MRREDLVDLNAFLTVAEERSFTRAATRLGTSQSALSHAMRRLEERVGVRLLTRTTRSVAPTEAGERLLEKLTPALSIVQAELESLSELRVKPSGTIRITTSKHAAKTILWPKISAFLPEYPDVHVELSLNSGFADIVVDRFDAGVRLGEALDKDMIAVPISPDLRMAVVASPSYLETHPIPETPQDIGNHVCIGQRRVTSGGIYAWELGKDGRDLRVRVDGQLAFDDDEMIITAALDGFGLAYVMEDYVQEHITSGRLRRVLEDWSAPFAGYYLYYPSRRQPSAAFSLLVDALRYRS